MKENYAKKYIKHIYTRLNVKPCPIKTYHSGGIYSLRRVKKFKKSQKLTGNYDLSCRFPNFTVVPIVQQIKPKITPAHGNFITGFIHQSFQNTCPSRRGREPGHVCHFPLITFLLYFIASHPPILNLNKSRGPLYRR